MAEPDLYRRLQQHLDRMPIGFPATASGVEISILKRLFSPEDAAIALELSAIAEPVDAIHPRLAWMCSLELLRARLDDMAARGLVLRGERHGTPRYGKLPFVLGIYEFQLPRLTAELERDVLQYFEEGFGTAVHTKGTTQMRTVPVNVSLTPERDVATYDDIRAHVRESPGPFAAMECICRLGKGLVGHPCVQTQRHDTCLTIGPAAEGMVRTGAARFVSREKMLELLDEADHDGLVLQPGNTQDPQFVCCCCGCCCGVLTTAKRLPQPAEYFSTNYYAEVDAERCEACGTCVGRCQMDAVSLDSGKAVVARSHCIGCALCVTTCPSDAMTLHQKDTRRVPPRNIPALYAQIYRERFGTLGLAMAAGRRFLGLKV